MFDEALKNKSKEKTLKITIGGLVTIIALLLVFIIVKSKLVYAKESDCQTGISSSVSTGSSEDNKPKLSSSFIDDDKNSFFATISRMKHIERWSLLKNTKKENLEEHSFEVAIIAHALANIKNKYFGGNVDCEKIVLLSLYHDATEIIADDIPTPVKYYTEDMKNAYDVVEEAAKDELLNLLPEDMRDIYEPILSHNESDSELWRLVKAADRISALIKCIEERKFGNSDFAKAEKATIEAIHGMNMDEVEYFLKEYMPAYGFVDIK